MITIRIFDTKEEAERAKWEVQKGGFKAVVTEDTFEGVPIQKFNVPARYRLRVEEGDFDKVTEYLASRLRKSRIKS
jgi:hypothetical protein